MEQIQHFSHKHPLIICDKHSSREGIVCYVCNKPIMGISNSFYRCTSNNATGNEMSCHDIFLHKTCAELLEKIEYPLHQFTLSSTHSHCFCNFCELELEGFAYICTDELCEFYICLTCAFQDRNIQHPSHNYKDHVLSLVQRQAWFRCDACGQKHEDSSSYTCNVYPFWMHHKCASLPTSIECIFHDDHPLTLAYSLPKRYCGSKQLCTICNKELKTI